MNIQHNIQYTQQKGNMHSINELYQYISIDL